VAILDIRQRSGYLFLVVILGQILLISAQVNTKSGVPVIERVTFGVFSELQRGLSGGFSGVRNVWTGYIGLRNLKVENDALKRDLANAVPHLSADARAWLAAALELSAPGHPWIPLLTEHT
jgi:hypothetical protein